MCVAAGDLAQAVSEAEAAGSGRVAVDMFLGRTSAAMGAMKLHRPETTAAKLADAVVAEMVA